MRRVLLVALATSACAAAASACAPAAAPVVTVPEPPPHASATVASPPPLPLAGNPFLEAGCKPTPTGPAFLDCTGARIEGIAACRTPLRVLSVRFEPRATVAECFVTGGAIPGVRQAGCMLPSSVLLVAALPTGFVLLHSREDVARTFAPVTSADEALAFAVGLTGEEAVAPTDPSAKQLGTTEVTEDGAGFHVRLFKSQTCGCSHPTWAVEHLVTRAGAVSEISRKVAWEDPKSRGLCVD